MQCRTNLHSANCRFHGKKSQVVAKLSDKGQVSILFRKCSVQELLLALLPKRDPLDFGFSLLTGLASLSVLFVIVGVFWVLVRESSLAISKFGVLECLLSTEWNP